MTPSDTIEPDKFLDEEEVKKVRTITAARCELDKKEGRRTWVVYWMIIDTALQTGFRLSEIRVLKIGDFDLKRRIISVTRLKRRDHPTEPFPMSDSLRKHIDEYIKWKSYNGEKTDADSYFLLSKRKKSRTMGVYSIRGMQKVWEKVKSVSQIASVYTFHSMRHTFGTSVLERDGDLTAVQKLLGHKRRKTAEIYGGVTWSRKKRIVNSLYENGGNGDESDVKE